MCTLAHKVVKLRKPRKAYAIRRYNPDGTYSPTSNNRNLRMRMGEMFVDPYSDEIPELVWFQAIIERGLHVSPTIRPLMDSLRELEWSSDGTDRLRIVEVDIPAGERIIEGVNYQCSRILSGLPSIVCRRYTITRARYEAIEYPFSAKLKQLEGKHHD